ncbi:hypothetical protein [Caballeronia sp. LZ001]|uniref:hypothetical protein n=1 Tax=Caballeronia sp. LZ001 TaxID=3038553 RepID=UPI0028631852|nr:hypothetical protein [Caballeronia sp. LZ001]MDR5801159.1 hypothetical protein [Caballeronia sp. LZ001]
MNEKNTGGPAFPVSTKMDDITGEFGHQDGMSTWQFGGMTLRDYFAVHSNLGDEIPVRLAMSLMNAAPPDYTADPVANSMYWAEVRARLRYMDADAMLRARDA